MMKKTLFSVALICALGFSILIKADDGETGHGNRDCTLTIENPTPCPDPPPQNRQAAGSDNSSSSAEDVFTWLIKHFGFK